MWSRLRQLGISLLLLGITAGILVGSGLCTRAPEIAEISPSITGSDLELTVTNNDAFDWTNVQLELNSAFRYGIAVIHAGETLHIQLQDFAKPDGTNFDPLRQTPSQLAIACETPQGEAQWIGSMSQPR
jgi:regulation of enolase protein 1 (concanavalin A-like superfamily)